MNMRNLWRALKSWLEIPIYFDPLQTDIPATIIGYSDEDRFGYVAVDGRRIGFMVDAVVGDVDLTRGAQVRVDYFWRRGCAVRVRRA